MPGERLTRAQRLGTPGERPTLRLGSPWGKVDYQANPTHKGLHLSTIQNWYSDASDHVLEPQFSNISNRITDDIIFILSLI